MMSYLLHYEGLHLALHEIIDLKCFRDLEPLAPSLELWLLFQVGVVHRLHCKAWVPDLALAGAGSLDQDL